MNVILSTTQIIMYVVLCFLFGLATLYISIVAFRYYKYVKWFNSTECGRVWKKARTNMTPFIMLNGRCYEGMKKEDIEDLLNEGSGS